jgi:hypothetical protein
MFSFEHMETPGQDLYGMPLVELDPLRVMVLVCF